MLIPIKALSVNQAWRGRRFKTPEYAKFERDVMFWIKANKIKPLALHDLIEVKYVFHMKHFAKADVDNLAKCLTDVLVKAKVIVDDRYIAKMILEKIKATDDKIEIYITDYEQRQRTHLAHHGKQ